jgi:hypothetical protein
VPEKIEHKLEKLSPDARRLYLEAKEVVVNTKDANSEQFKTASRIVRTFWKRIFRDRPLSATIDSITRT